MDMIPLSLALGIGYMITMKKMAMFKPSPSPQSKHIIIKVLGGFCLLGAIGLWVLYFLGSSQSNADVLNTIDFSCIVLGWAVYCFYFKSSDSKWWGKVLKFLYGFFLLGFYDASFAFNRIWYFGVIVFCVMCSLVEWAYKAQKKKEDKEKEMAEKEKDFHSIIDTNGASKNESPYGEIWRQEMENKSYDELIRILSNPRHYNAGFVKMAWDRLKSFENFNETEVEAQIKELREQAATPIVKGNRCPYCGKKIEKGTSFCKHCGKPLKYV